jgi:hypothetical protein
MTSVVLLTEAEADAIRGPSTVSPALAIAPCPLTDGRFLVPADVESDPYHAAHWELLGGLPHDTYANIAHLVPEPEPRP